MRGEGARLIGAIAGCTTHGAVQTTFLKRQMDAFLQANNLISIERLDFRNTQLQRELVQTLPGPRAPPYRTMVAETKGMDCGK